MTRESCAGGVADTGVEDDGDGPRDPADETFGGCCGGPDDCPFRSGPTLLTGSGC